MDCLFGGVVGVIVDDDNDDDDDIKCVGFFVTDGARLVLCDVGRLSTEPESQQWHLDLGWL